MALAPARVVATARQIAAVSKEIRDALARVDQIVAYNSHQSIDWNAGEKPDYLPLDADGNIDGLEFAPADVSNAIFSLTQFQAVLKNEQTTKGDHLGNLNKVADPS